ncbi:rhomboid family intramembrane serine protease [Nocardioides sp. GCM10027113]|uniref:rhomboid family intramembrane serine protease n=1 Tax=unclassified Nocardioides TaxID=2615069 RepID=UPI003621CD76
MPTCYRHPGRETYISCQRCERPICPDCMRDAAVGFQCPGCVAEGAKTTRSGRTAYGGIRPGNPGLTSLVLIVVNAAVWLVLSGTGRYRSELYSRLALLPEGRCVPTGSPEQYFPGIPNEQICDLQGQQWVSGVADGAWWQLLTSAFTHVELWHIGFNMLALWILAPQLEQAVGRARFLALYFLSALSGSTLVYWLAAPQGSTLGASGAVFGLLGALLVLAHKVRGDVRGLLLWLGLNAVITVMVPNISWQGHLGGFLGGLAICAVLVHSPRRHRTAWQVAGLALIAVVLAAALVARTLVLA